MAVQGFHTERHGGYFAGETYNRCVLCAQRTVENRTAGVPERYMRTGASRLEDVRKGGKPGENPPGRNVGTTDPYKAGQPSPARFRLINGIPYES